MKIGQTQLRMKGEFDTMEENALDAAQAAQSVQSRTRAEEIAEAELQKLFLARLDVHSKIEEMKRNRATLRSRKVDVERKIACLSEFHAKLLQREEELSRSMTES